MSRKAPVRDRTQDKTAPPHRRGRCCPLLHLGEDSGEGDQGWPGVPPRLQDHKKRNAFRRLMIFAATAFVECDNSLMTTTGRSTDDRPSPPTCAPCDCGRTSPRTTCGRLLALTAVRSSTSRRGTKSWSARSCGSPTSWKCRLPSWTSDPPRRLRQGRRRYGGPYAPGQDVFRPEACPPSPSSGRGAGRAIGGGQPTCCWRRGRRGGGPPGGSGPGVGGVVSTLIGEFPSSHGGWERCAARPRDLCESERGRGASLGETWGRLLAAAGGTKDRCPHRPAAGSFLDSGASHSAVDP